jgi:hypothetical protein
MEKRTLTITRAVRVTGTAKRRERMRRKAINQEGKQIIREYIASGIREVAPAQDELSGELAKP